MGIDIIKFSMFLLHALPVSHMMYFGETKLFLLLVSLFQLTFCGLFPIRNIKKM